MSDPSPSRLLFDDFELRPDRGGLFRAGEPVKLQPQPTKVLEILVSRSGEIVSREELRKLVWGDSFLDFDASLNFCIKEIRQALGDSATEPRYVETITRQGYRFLKPVRIEPPPQAAPEPPVALNRRPRLAALAVAVAAVAILIFLVGSRQLHQPLPPATPAPAPRYSPSPEAHAAYIQGVYFFGRMEYGKAGRKMGDAIRLDPRFAPPYAYLARARLLDEDRAWQDLPGIEAQIRRSLELEPDLAVAHIAAGYLAYVYRLDWEQAGRELERAVALEPTSADAHYLYGTYLGLLGYRDEAVAAVERAREIDPNSMLFRSDLAWQLYLARRYNEAIVEARGTLDMLEASGGGVTPLQAEFGRFWSSWVILHSSWRQGDKAADAKAVKVLMGNRLPEAELTPLRTLHELWAFRYRWLTEELAQSKPVPPFPRAAAAAAVGDTDQALKVLEEECQGKRWGFLLLATAVEPVFDSLRGDPRFTRVIDCLRLPADAPARRGLPAL